MSMNVLFCNLVTINILFFWNRETLPSYQIIIFFRKRAFFGYF